MTFTPTVYDLALYFSDDSGQLAAHWVPSAIYKAEAYGKPEPIWKMADFIEAPVDRGGFCYVANLSKLLLPSAEKSPPVKASITGLRPKEKDLVIVPPDEPDMAYVVRRDVYVDTDKCPEVGRDPTASDLNFMALNQGVILANVPKPTNCSGWTCYLLSLLSLKSGALPGGEGQDKTTHFAALREKMKY
jgi:hypothetical protein